MVVSHLTLKCKESLHLLRFSGHHRFCSFPCFSWPEPGMNLPSQGKDLSLHPKSPEDALALSIISESGFSRSLPEHRQQRYWSLSSLAQVSEGALEKAAPFNYRAADPFTLPWLPAAVHLCDPLCDTGGVTVRGRGRCKTDFPFSHTQTPSLPFFFFFPSTHLSCSRCPLGFHMFHQSTLIFYSTGWQAHDPCPGILQPEEASEGETSPVHADGWCGCWALRRAQPALPSCSWLLPVCLPEPLPLQDTFTALSYAWRNISAVLFFFLYLSFHVFFCFLRFTPSPFLC